MKVRESTAKTLVVHLALGNTHNTDDPQLLDRCIARILPFSQDPLKLINIINGFFPQTHDQRVLIDEEPLSRLSLVPNEPIVLRMKARVLLQSPKSALQHQQAIVDIDLVATPVQPDGSLYNKILAIQEAHVLYTTTGKLISEKYFSDILKGPMALVFF